MPIFARPMDVNAFSLTYKDQEGVLTKIYTGKLYVDAEISVFGNNATKYTNKMSEGIVCKLIWLNNLEISMATYDNLMKNLTQLQFNLDKLFNLNNARTFVRFYAEDFEYNQLIDTHNIIRLAERIVMRKIVSVDKTSLERRLGNACCVVFVQAYCDDCADAVRMLEKTKNSEDTVTVVQINDLEERIKEELSSYGSPPVIFIGTRHIPFSDLKVSSAIEIELIKEQLATCRYGRHWS